MQRKIFHQLATWKARKNRKPLIVQGARQVGKTWLMNAFGEQQFEQKAYFNFETQAELSVLFQHNLRPNELLKGLSVFCGFAIEPTRCLIIFDEIQACPEALTALKYFQEELPDSYVLAAGSLLGVAMHKGASFPVGKVEFLKLYPLDFHEFLSACKQDALVQLLETGSVDLLRAFEPTLLHYLREYFFTGGMPEVVKHYVVGAHPNELRKIQVEILNAYENDFSKHAPVAQVPRLRLIWNSLVSQLAKENSKFIYNILRSGARAKDFELAIEWLKDAGLVHKVNRVTKSGMPLSAYASQSDFKLFFLDTGLLAAMAKITKESLVAGSDKLTEFKGVLAEQFVLQQLVANEVQPFYWHPENAQAEVDFVVQTADDCIPIEVKSGNSLHAKSLYVYQQKYAPTKCLRASMGFYRQNDWLHDIPLYGIISELKKWMNPTGHSS
jgi:predicted AAA+ superfamily ATPase